MGVFVPWRDLQNKKPPVPLDSAIRRSMTSWTGTSNGRKVAHQEREALGPTSARSA